MNVPKNAEAKHRAVILVSAFVHELNQHGECVGEPTMVIGQFPLALDGENDQHCRSRLNATLEELKQKCKT